MTFSREFQVFVKPVGANCNLACTYCYYLDKQQLHKGETFLKMPETILEKYIGQHIEATTENLVLFSWHGGEPTLLGIDYFKKIVEFQKKQNVDGKRIVNGIQTNGTNLDEKWCNFFVEENFIVGISIDGPEHLHNKFRVSKSGKGSFLNVLKSFELLKKHDINCEILCVVNAHNVQYPKDVYAFFRTMDTQFISFLPLVEKIKGSASEVSNDSVPAEAFGDFLIYIFDEWIEHDIGNIKIQLFEEAFRIAFNQEHTLCIVKKTCGGVPVLERNGDLYSCDHFVNHENLLGNINDFQLAELLDSPKQQQFGKAKYSALPNYCLNCDVLSMCNGECPKNRFIKSPSGKEELNYLCEGYKKFFRYCTPFIDAISSVWDRK
jgi:uncharacterized protein